MKSILCIFIFLLSRNSLSATMPCHVKTITSRDMVGIENHLKNSDYKSLECFIASLPKDIRAFRTYFKSSLSLQGASVTHPRAIIGSPDGGFFLTFNGHAKQKGYNEIEILALDKNIGPNRWVPAVIEQKNGQLILTKNVSKCSSCHGNPIRPIWGKYPLWPNSFGSVDDWLPDLDDLKKGSHFFEQDQSANAYGQNEHPRLSREKIEIAKIESEQFRSFRKMAKKHPRYSKLEAASDKRSPVYPYTESYRGRNNAFRPNLTIGTVMTLRQNEILLRRITNDKIYQTYKNTFLYYEKCQINEDADPYQRIVHNFISHAYELIYSNLIPKNSHYDTDYFSENYFDLLAQPHEKTLLFASDTYYLNEENRYFHSGYLSISDHVMDKLLMNLIKGWNDPERFLVLDLQHYNPYRNLEEAKASSPYFSYFESDFLGQKMYQRLQASYTSVYFNGASHKEATINQKAIHAEMCGRLRHASIAELKLFDEKIFTKTTVENHPWPKALNSCIKCHDSGNGIAIPIPFSSPKKLENFSLSFKSAYGWGSLFDSVDLITMSEVLPAAHLSGARMPLGQAPLTSFERQAIRTWIEQGHTLQSRTQTD